MRISFCEFLHKSGIIDDINSILLDGDYQNYRNALRALDAFLTAHAMFEHELLEYMSSDER